MGTRQTDISPVYEHVSLIRLWLADASVLFVSKLQILGDKHLCQPTWRLCHDADFYCDFLGRGWGRPRASCVDFGLQHGLGVRLVSNESRANCDFYVWDSIQSKMIYLWIFQSLFFKKAK
jgi:hypothetical protein